MGEAVSPVVDKETIEAGSQALVRASNPNVFPSLVALLAIAAVGLLLYWDRQDRREANVAMVRALERVGEHVQHVEEALQVRHKSRVVNAVDRDSE